jgi:acetyl esterase/lipase
MATHYFGEDSSWRLWSDSAAREDLVFEVSAPAHEAVISDVFRPRLFLFEAKKPSGRAALVLAGGGYTKLVIGKEGVEVARWLNTLGVHAFVLAHRFPGRSGSQAPVDDAIEAMRQIRARAGEWGVDAGKIGVCGLSSGGHRVAWWRGIPTCGVPTSRRTRT